MSVSPPLEQKWFILVCHRFISAQTPGSGAYRYVGMLRYSLYLNVGVCTVRKAPQLFSILVLYLSVSELQ